MGTTGFDAVYGWEDSLIWFRTLVGMVRTCLFTEIWLLNNILLEFTVLLFPFICTFALVLASGATFDDLFFLDYCYAFF